MYAAWVVAVCWVDVPDADECTDTPGPGKADDVAELGAKIVSGTGTWCD